MAASKATCGIMAIIQATGMCRKDVLTHIETGKIKAEKKGKQFAFDISEKGRLESLHDTYAGFFHLAQKYGDENSSFSFTKPKCRHELIEFAVKNSWFGANVIPVDAVFFAGPGNEMYFVRKNDEYRFAPQVQLWLSSYGQNAETKLRLLLERLRELYPETGNHFGKFLTLKYHNDYAAAWMLADFLCAVLNNEIIKMDDKALERLVKKIDKELPLGSAHIFSAFLTYLRSKRKLNNGWTYQFKSRGGKRENGAYSAISYLKMAYIVFNKDAWAAEGLIEKALSSNRYANLWIFVAFHFVCGWRGSDIIRIPMPSLPSDGKTIREQILAGRFDAESLLKEMELRLRYVPLKPHKTQSFNVPDLKLFVAESLRKPLSIIFAIAASFHEDVPPGAGFIRQAGSFAELQEFFGEEFVAACGNKGFSTRRANKSYLQGIESSAADTPGKPKGYMLAALARSHKNGYGALPQTTEVYIRDASFSGYSPEFIAREMFERGVFSFIPALLLDMYKGKQYGKLPVSIQTNLIMEIGISPSGLENLSATVQYALDKSHRAIAAIMAHPLEMRESVADILQNIASGNAPGRQDGCLCLMTAAGLSCNDPDRSCCIGCGYEIYTKTILRLLMAEYSRLLNKKKVSDATEAARCNAILKKAVLPAISEILSSSTRLYPDADMKPLLDELERGVCLC